jgi:hypothetical protein
MKRAFVLYELILSIVLASIIFITTSKLIFDLTQKNSFNYQITTAKLEFESTKMFLQNLLDKNTTLNNISYSDDKLLYDGHILLKDVISFTKSDKKINICINNKLNICQEWILK